jgi:hypothetical protein
MLGMEAYLGRRALDYVDAIEASALNASVISQFVKMMEGCGFYADIVADIPCARQTLRQLTLANSWPVKWSEHHNKRDFAEVAPVLRHCLRTFNSFAWISFCREVGQNQPTPIRRGQGLDSITRRTLPDIFLPPPRPAVQPTQ